MTGSRDDLGMSQRVLTVLVDPQVKRHEIEVTKSFPRESRLPQLLVIRGLPTL